MAASNLKKTKTTKTTKSNALGKGLGRGIGALIPEADTDEEKVVVKESNDQMAAGYQ